jgi:hypothetical protein
MMKKIYSVILLCALIFSFHNKALAQASSDWAFIGLTVSGINISEGVEAFYQASTCNGKDVIYLKFINHNKYAVKLEWADAVFTQDLKWFYRDNTADKKSITIPANSEVKGECTNSSAVTSGKANNFHAELSVEMKDFIADKANFKRYSASDLKITSVQ